MRVLVLRPAIQAARTAEILAGLGHRPIVCPVLTIATLDAPPPAGRFDGLLVTSANAAPALARHRDALPARAYAVGGETGRAVRGSGFRDVIVAEGDAVRLAALVAACLAPGSRLLHAVGRDRRPEPARSLGRSGIAVVAWETYAAEAATSFSVEAADAIRDGEVDAVLHFSPRSAAVATGLAAETGLAEEWATLVHSCLSQNVADALPAGTPRIRVATEPNEQALLALLAE